MLGDVVVKQMPVLARLSFIVREVRSRLFWLRSIDYMVSWRCDSDSYFYFRGLTNSVVHDDVRESFVMNLSEKWSGGVVRYSSFTWPLCSSTVRSSPSVL